MMRARVPVLQYMGMLVGLAKNPLISLQNQRIAEGYVLFDDLNIHILQSLLRRVNEGVPMPTRYEGRVGIVEETRNNLPFSGGIDPRKMSNVLDGYHKKSARWFACRCPVHDGISTDSMVINADTGRWYCHSGCSSTEIHKALKALQEAK